MLFRVIAPPRPSVTVVHAHDLPHLATAYAGFAEDELEELDDLHRRRIVPRIAEAVTRVARGQESAPTDVPVFKTYVRTGDPRAVIKAAVKKLDTDLLLLGTHGYSGVAHMFLGTVAGDVLRDVRCDVLVVPPRRRTRGPG
jgi:nucleotide-binding universal stress UspA family protein